jgi:hypothetical protein
MDQGEISITQALNQLQSWLNAKEYEKVIQGCREILEMDPSNMRATALLRQAMEGSQAEPAPQAEPVQAADPLADLQVEPTPAPAPSPAPAPAPEVDMFENKLPSKKEAMKLFLATLIPALIVVLVGGFFITRFLLQDRNETIVENQTPVTPANTEYLGQNETRVQDLVKMEGLIEDFKQKNGAYPSVEQAEELLSTFKDPKHGSFDKAGRPYGYAYAVYATLEGPNTAYILSALFEDSQGFGNLWSRGEEASRFDGYRDLESSNVLLLGPAIDVPSNAPEDTRTPGPKVKS